MPRSNFFNRMDIRYYLVLTIFVWAFSYILYILPVGQQLEQNIGLNFMYSLRGDQPAPSNVLVVSIDRRSADKLGLPNQLRKWPRNVYAKLVDKLNLLNASVIGFDIFFREEKSKKNNLLLSNSFRKSNNIILFDFLKKDIISKNGKIIEFDTVVSPISILKESAFATGIFPLPRIPNKVNQVWLFKPEIAQKATLPVQMYMLNQQKLHDRLVKLLETVFPEVWENHKNKYHQTDNLVQIIRLFFVNNPEYIRQITQELNNKNNKFDFKSQDFLTLSKFYTGDHSRHLNFYGVRHTIRTVAISDVLDSAFQENLTDTAVFVGFSDLSATEEKDNFLTNIGQDSMSFIAGVEIAATEYANLKNNNFLRVLSYGESAILLLVFSVIFIAILSCIQTKYFFINFIILNTLYVFLASQLFSQYYVWLPLIVPIIFQSSFILVFILFYRFMKVYKEKKNIREAFSFYLPADIISQLEEDANSLLSSKESTYGICMSTDIAQYTTLSEKTFPTDLHQLMNRYFSAIFSPVKENNGYVSDVVGDAMLAVWLNPEKNDRIKLQACSAAIGVHQASEQFFNQNQATPLPTRLGLHCGEMAIGNLGAAGRYEYRAIGDIVNTACRLEGLNKILATSILISEELQAGLPNINSRNLGSFILKGKTKPLIVFELLGINQKLPYDVILKHEKFDIAKEEFFLGNVSRANLLFSEIIMEFKDDGPSKFYQTLCKMLLEPESHQQTSYFFETSTGNIHITSK